MNKLIIKRLTGQVANATRPLMTVDKGRSMVEMLKKRYHSSACAARQAVQESHLSALRFERIYAASQSLGRSMVEMLGVLAIIGVLSAGAIAGYSKAMFQYKINKTVDQVMQTVIKTQTLFINEPEATKYKALEGKGKALEYKLYPTPYNEKNMSQFSEKGIQNEFAGDFVIGKIGDTLDYYFSIYLSLPSKACVALASYNWGSKDSHLVGVVVNPIFDGDTASLTADCQGIGASDSGEGYLACSDSIPMPMEYVTEACACEGLNCEIILKFQ